MNQFPGTRALSTVEAAGRHLNFTRAADELGLTPAAVSHQIKEFEDRLGFALFARTSRVATLTEAGIVIHEAVAEALGSLHHAAMRARKLARGASELKVTTDATFASRWLLPRIEQFRKLRPEIELRFDATSQLRDFRRDDVDVAIRFGTGRYPGLVAECLFENIVIPVCSPKLLETGPPLETPRDLFRHTLVHLEWSRMGVTWPNWRMWMAAAGVKDFDDAKCVCVAFEDSAHAVQAALDGSAVALADSAMVAGDLSAGRLVRLFDLGMRPPAEFAYYLVYPTESADDQRIVAFRNWIFEEAAQTQEEPASHP